MFTDISIAPACSFVQERRKALWKYRQEILHPVETYSNYENGDPLRREVLLMGKILVKRQQDVEQRVGQCQEISIFYRTTQTERSCDSHLRAVIGALALRGQR